MSNMSYCRFENTLRDLEDCVDHMDDTLASPTEHEARRMLVALCAEIAAEYTSERVVPIRRRG